MYRTFQDHDQGIDRFAFEKPSKEIITLDLHPKDNGGVSGFLSLLERSQPEGEFFPRQMEFIIKEEPLSIIRRTTTYFPENPPIEQGEIKQMQTSIHFDVLEPKAKRYKKYKPNYRKD